MNKAFIIGLSVWIIYLIDHLIDSKEPYYAESEQHHFFIKYRQRLIVLIAGLALVNVFLIVKYLPLDYLEYGLILGIVFVLYFLAHHFIKGKSRIFFPKELLISIIYAAAIWFFPLMLKTYMPVKKNLFLMIIFYLVVLNNVLLFSFFQKNDDKQTQKISFITMLAEKHWIAGIASLSVLCLLSTILFLIFNRISIHAYTLFFISLIYYLEITFLDKKFVKAHYAKITDGAFLLFLIFLFI